MKRDNKTRSSDIPDSVLKDGSEPRCLLQTTSINNLASPSKNTCWQEWAVCKLPGVQNLQQPWHLKHVVVVAEHIQRWSPCHSCLSWSHHGLLLKKQDQKPPSRFILKIPGGGGCHVIGSNSGGVPVSWFDES